MSDGRSPEAGLVAFVAELRTAGLAAPVDSTVLFVRAVAAVGGTDTHAVFWAGRATLVSHPDDIDTYSRVFAHFWLGSSSSTAVEAIETVTLLIDDDNEGDGPEAEAEPEVLEGPTLTVRFSRSISESRMRRGMGGSSQNPVKSLEQKFRG